MAQPVAWNQMRWDLSHVSLGLTAAVLDFDVQDVQVVTIFACESFGQTLSMSIETCNDIEAKVLFTSTPGIIQGAMKLFKYSGDDIALLFVKSRAGVQFLGLACSLTTLPLFDAAEALCEMMKSTASSPILVPSTAQLGKLLEFLKPSCSKSTFAAKVIEYEDVVRQAQVRFGRNTKIVGQEPYESPTPRDIATVVGLFRKTFHNIGTETHIAEIKTGPCAVWVAAFAEWYLGIMPSIYVLTDNAVRQKVLEHGSSIVRIIISSDANHKHTPLTATAILKVPSPEPPLFVLVGDQSAGKSSILDAIFDTILEVPYKAMIAKGSCEPTTFVTEFRLRRGDERISVGVIPGKDCGAEDRNRFSKLNYCSTDQSRLTKFINECKSFMRHTSGPVNSCRLASPDIMTVEISAPTIPNLTLVDLPGFFHADTSMHSLEGMKIINDIAADYMSVPTAIVLAVIDGRADPVLQSSVHKISQNKNANIRNVGVITKADLLVEKDVSRVLDVLGRSGIKLNHGWHFLRNRTPDETGCPAHVRNQIEREFFNQSIWDILSSGNCGIQSLVTTMSTFLPAGIAQHSSLPPDPGINIEQNTESSVYDQSDIESIFSIASLGSSNSSVADVFTIAVSEWVMLLLDDKGLMLLFSIALSKLGPKRFQRNFARLLRKYGQNLKIEALNEAQGHSAHFAQQSARRTATEITHVLATDGMQLNKPPEHISKTQKLAQVNHWLESHSADRVAPHAGDMPNSEPYASRHVDGDESGSDADSDISEISKAPSLHTLNDTKEFMISSEAFSTLRHDFQDWLNLGEPKHGRVDKAGTWALAKGRLINILCPLAAGYNRLSYVFGCGDLVYLDVKELSRGGIARFRRRLRAAALAAQQQDSSYSNAPRVPPRVYSKHKGTGVRSGDNSANFQDGVPLQSQLSPSRSDRNTITAFQNPDLQFLLLCVDTKTSTALAHIEVGSMTNDQYLFQEIYETYQRIRDEHEWRLTMIFPIWLRNLFTRATKQIRRSMLIPTPINNLSNLIQAFGSVHLRRISHGDFVRFQLVPIGDKCCPTWFQSPELPPESEVAAGRYLYQPVPMNDVEISEIPLAHLLKPGPHLDKFWLATFPKKLSEQLRRPAGTSHQVIGWGIRINDRLNWAIALLGLLVILILISIGVITYSVVTSDNSSAFGLGAFLVALFTVYLTYQYFSWKEDL